MSTKKTELHKFSSGATSSLKLPAYHLIPPSIVLKLAERFSLGAEKHGDVNYQKCITYNEDGSRTLDISFARDRYNHSVHHLLNLKKTGNTKDDNVSAVAWFLAYASWVEELGFDWGRILNPVYVNEKSITVYESGDFKVSY